MMKMMALCDETAPATQPACAVREEKLRLARRYGLSPAQIDDLSRRVGCGRKALEAAIGLLRRCDTRWTVGT